MATTTHNFDVDCKFESDGSIGKQSFSFDDTAKDKILIGPFTLDKTSGQWELKFKSNTTPMLKDIAKEIALSGESTGSDVTIKLKKVTIDSKGNVKFELESTTGRTSGSTRMFTITPNSVQFRSGTKTKELPAAPGKNTMPVTLPKNFIQLFMTGQKDSTFTSLPPQLFEEIIKDKGSTFDELKKGGIADTLTITTKDKTPIKILRVEDKSTSPSTFKLYTQYNTQIAQISNCFHIKSPSDEMYFTFPSTPPKTFSFEMDQINQESFAKFAFPSERDPISHWKNHKDRAFDTVPGKIDGPLKTRDIPAKKANDKITPPAATLIEQDPTTGCWKIDGKVTSFKFQGAKGADATGKEPTMDSTTKNWIDGLGAATSVRAEAFDGTPAENQPKIGSSGFWEINGNPTTFRHAGEDGKIADIPEVDPATNCWKINGVVTSLPSSTPITIVGDTWVENNGTATGKPIAGLTDVSSIGAKGADGGDATIDPTTKHWMFGGVDSTIDAEAHAKMKTKIERDPSGYWVINGIISTTIKWKGDVGNAGVLPVIGADRKYIINGKKTDKLAMDRDGKTHDQPFVDPADADGKIKIGTKEFASINGQPGEELNAPSADPTDGKLIINGEKTTLDAATTDIMLNSSGEWVIDDGTPDGQEIIGLKNKSAVAKQGKDGAKTIIGTNGNFFIDGVDTGMPAVMQEKEKTKDDSKSKSSPFDFTMAPLFYGLGLLAGVLGIVTGMVWLIALAALAFATPKLTKDLINDYRSHKTSEEKEKSKKQRAIIKQRRKDLRLAKNRIKTGAKTLAPNPTYEAAINSIFNKRSSKSRGTIDKNAKDALINMDYRALMHADKLEAQSRKIKDMKAYFENLQKEFDAKVTDPTKYASEIAEFKSRMSKINTNLSSLEKENTNIVECYDACEALKKKLSSTPHLVTQDELRYTFETVMGIKENLIFDPATSNSIATDPAMQDGLKTEIGSRYGGYSTNARTYIDDLDTEATGLFNLLDGIKGTDGPKRDVDFELPKL